MSDQKTVEWMRSHKEEVERVRRRHDELKGLSLQSLLEAASLDDAGVDKIKEILIAKIITAESK